MFIGVFKKFSVFSPFGSYFRSSIFLSAHILCFLLSSCRIKEDHVIQHGLVVDGASLSLALREHEKLFMEVCKNCSAVLCCRMAPLQKAKVFVPCNTNTPSLLLLLLLDTLLPLVYDVHVFKC